MIEYSPYSYVYEMIRKKNIVVWKKNYNKLNIIWKRNYNNFSCHVVGKTVWSFIRKIAKLHVGLLDFTWLYMRKIMFGL